MKTPSNLPPGCTSDDGGIDHDYEAALEELTGKVNNYRTLQMLSNIVDAVQSIYDAGFADGIRDERTNQLEEDWLALSYRRSWS